MNRVRRDAEPDARLAHTGPESFTEGAHMNRIQVLRLSRGALAAALMPCSHARAEVFADGSGIALQQMAASTTEWLPELLDLAVRAWKSAPLRFSRTGRISSSFARYRRSS